MPTERDKYVWLVQSRRRSVDQDLEGGLTRQCNTRLSFLIMCCVWESLSQDDYGGLLRSRWTCSRSGRVLVILSKHTFYKRFHSSLCQRNYEQVRLVHQMVIAVPVPQIQEQIVDVIEVIPEEWMSKLTVQQIVAVPVPQFPEQTVEVMKGSADFDQCFLEGCGSLAKARATARVDVPTQNVEVIKVVLQEQCQRFFFIVESVWEGRCGQHGKSVCCPTVHRHTRGLILSASDGIWDMLFATYSHTSHWVRFGGHFRHMCECSLTRSTF